MPTVVSNGFKGYNAVSSTTTDPFSVTAGQRVVFFCVWQSRAAVPTFSFSPTLIDNGQCGAITSGGNWYGAWYVDIVANNASYTITANQADGYTSIFYVVLDGPFGNTVSNKSDLDASPYSVALTTTEVDALLLGFIAPEGQADTMTDIDTTPNSFTELHQIISFSFWQGATAHRDAVSVGSYTFAPTVAGGGVATAGLILVAIYPPSGGPPPEEPLPGFLMIYEGGQWQQYLGTVRQGSAWLSNLPKGYVP